MLCAVAAAMAPVFVHASARRSDGDDAALAALVSRATIAVNSHNPAAMIPVAEASASGAFRWVTGTTTRSWDGGILTPPGSTDRLMVFHAWHGCESDGDHVHHLAQDGSGWKVGAEIPETETGGFLIRDHDLNIHMDAPHAALAITDTVKFEKIADSPAAYALMRLSQDFHVSEIRQDGPSGTPVPFTQTGGVIAFTPPPGNTFTLYMAYAGTLQHKESDYFRGNEATIDSYWYPNIARLPATATFTVTAPPGWIPVAQGDLVKQSTDADGHTTVTYRNNIPVSYFTLDAGKYSVTTRNVDGVQLSAYLLTSDTKTANASLDLLQNALKFFSAHFSPYPYKRYSLVETGGPFPGALEAYSFATYGPRTLPVALVHELSHTWWGGIIPCAYTRSMWNESFANYSDGLYGRMAHSGYRPVDDIPASFLRSAKINRMPFAQGTMATAYDTTDQFQAGVGYTKGSLVLRLLENELGQATMLKCMRQFLADHVPGTAAEWTDFEAAVAKATGESYAWFFDEWLNRPGLPRLRLTNVTQHRAAGETVVEGDILQEGEPYQVDMPVKVSTSNSALTQTVKVMGAKTHFVLHAPGHVSRVLLDPDGIVPFVGTSGSKGDPGVFQFTYLTPRSPSLAPRSSVGKGMAEPLRLARSRVC
jgi:aminopeptidase N